MIYIINRIKIRHVNTVMGILKNWKWHRDFQGQRKVRQIIPIDQIASTTTDNTEIPIDLISWGKLPKTGSDWQPSWIYKVKERSDGFGHASDRFSDPQNPLKHILTNAIVYHEGKIGNPEAIQSRHLGFPRSNKGQAVSIILPIY